MQDDLVEITITSWDRFKPRLLTVETSLLGASMEFVHDGRQVKIQLPGETDIVEGKGVGTGRTASLASWYESEGGKVPSAYNVHGVDLTMSTGTTMHLPSEILKRRPKAIEVVSESQRTQLDELAKQAGDWAAHAFDRWLRIVRWKMMNTRIGRPEISGPESGWATYLRDEATSQDIWIGTQYFYVWGGPCVVADLWREMEQALQAQEDPPIHLELLLDAEDLLLHGQLNRCVVELAMACEAFIKRRVSDSLPQDLRPKAREAVRRANMRGPNSAIDMFEETLGKDQKKWRALKNTMDSLFKARNTVLHDGRNKALTKDECEKFRDAARHLFLLR